MNALLEERAGPSAVEWEAASAEALRSAAQLKQIAESGQVGFWEWDLRTNRVAFSPEWKRQLDHAEHAVDGARSEWEGSIHPDDFAASLQELRRCLDNPGRSYRLEFRLKHKDDTYRWILAEGSVLCDADGQPLSVVGTHVDLTERKRVEAQLHESQDRLAASELRFGTLFELAPVAMAVHRADGRFLQTNRAYQEMLGYSHEELARLGPARVTHPDDNAEGQRRFRELATGQQDRYWREKRFVRQDGRVVRARSSNAAIRGPGGDLLFIVSVVQDVTAEKRAAESNAALGRLALELCASKTPVQAAHIILDTASTLFGWDACYLHLDSPDGGQVSPIVTMDTLGGRRVEVPPAITGRGKSPLMAEVMQHGARLISRDPTAAATAEALQLVPFGDTARRSASIMCVPLRHGPTVVGVLSIQSYTPQAYRPEDLDLFQVLADQCGGAMERLRAEARVKRLEAEIVEISAREQRRIGFELHDGLGQTLAGIALKAKLLEQRLREHAVDQASEAAAMVRLLNQALSDTRRLARGLAPTELELSGLPVALERLGQETAASAGIACRVTCQPNDLLLPPGVALHLYRIVQEAVHNALTHGHPRALEISLTSQNAQLCLVVRDDGAGFNPGTSAQSGMGLNIMRHRADAIGGTFTLRSVAGQGTEIRCVLPEPSLKGGSHQTVAGR